MKHDKEREIAIWRMSILGTLERAPRTRWPAGPRAANPAWSGTAT